MTAILTQNEGTHRGEFVKHIGEGSISVEAGTLLLAQNLVAGTVLARTAAGTASQAYAGTGNGVLTLDATAPVQSTGKAGKYVVKCITAAANGGTFRVENPDGDVIGDVLVGATFADDIKFAIADGSTDFAVGDTFTITVTAESATYRQLVLAGTDGTEVPAGILMGKADATDAAQAITVIVRLAEVNDALLTWPAGITSAQKAAAKAVLAQSNIIVR